MTLKLWLYVCIICTSIVSCKCSNNEQIRDGTSLKGTSVRQLLKNSDFRSVVISLENQLDVPLSGGETYLKYGNSTLAAPTTVNPRTHEAIVLNKAWRDLRGVTGIVGYKVTDPKESLRFAIVFSVPFSFALYNNWFRLSVISDGHPIDKNLYKELSKPSSNSTTTKLGYAKENDILKITKGSYEITATMSNEVQSLVRVVVKRLTT